MIEREDLLFAVFSQNLRRVDFQVFLFFKFVAVLDHLQPTAVCRNRGVE